MASLGAIAVGRAVAITVLAERRAGQEAAYADDMSDKMKQLATGVLSIEQLLSYANHNPTAYSDVIWRELLAQSITIVGLLDEYTTEVEAPSSMEETHALVLEATRSCNTYAENVSDAVFDHTERNSQEFNASMDAAAQARSECGTRVLAAVEALDQITGNEGHEPGNTSGEISAEMPASTITAVEISWRRFWGSYRLAGKNAPA